jgi:methyltransferase-like protein
MSTGQIQWFAGEILKSLLPKSCIFQTGLSKNRPQIITMISSDHWYQKYLKYSEKHHKCVFLPSQLSEKTVGFPFGHPHVP